MSPVSGEMIRSAIRYSGNEASVGTDVVVVGDVVELVGATVVVVAAVVVVVSAVVAAGSLDEVHEATTSAVAIRR